MLPSRNPYGSYLGRVRPEFQNPIKSLSRWLLKRCVALGRGVGERTNACRLELAGCLDCNNRVDGAKDFAGGYPLVFALRQRGGSRGNRRLMKQVPQLEDEEGDEVEALRAISAMVRKERWGSQHRPHTQHHALTSSSDYYELPSPTRQRHAAG